MYVIACEPRDKVNRRICLSALFLLEKKLNFDINVFPLTLASKTNHVLVVTLTRVGSVGFN